MQGEPIMAGRQREGWLDYSKGLGILFVVFAHCITRLGSGGGIRFIWITIYTMHMPLFFVLAGFVLNTQKSVLGFLVGKLKRLMGAYFLFAMLTTAFYTGIDFLLNRSTTIDEIKNGIFDILIMSEESRFSYLWFLPVMFWGVIISFLLARFISDNRLIYLISVALVMINQLWVNNEIKSIFGLRESLYAQLFILIGYFLKQNINIIKSSTSYLLCFAFFLIWLWGSYEWMIHGYETVDYWNSHISPFSWTFFLAMTGTIAILMFAVIRNRNVTKSYKIVGILGRYSINIYGIHQVFLNVFSGVLSRIPDMPAIVRLLLYFVLVTLFSILISLVIETVHKKSMANKAKMISC